MRVDAFDFDLPEELIALRPASPRDAARLLVVRENGISEHRSVKELPDLLRAGDVLVVNDTKVFPARLQGRRFGRETGEAAAIEILLHKRVSPSGFRALVRPAKRLKPGDRILLGVTLEGTVVSREGPEAEILFHKQGAALDDAIAAEGEPPLPHYIAGRRNADSRDVGDYQTIYAARSGSVAAPTAGFHFTPELLARLADAGIARVHVTLHVGAGTFLPVNVEDTKDHVMHAEWAELSPETAQT